MAGLLAHGSTLARPFPKTSSAQCGKAVSVVYASSSSFTVAGTAPDSCKSDAMITTTPGSLFALSGTIERDYLGVMTMMQANPDCRARYYVKNRYPVLL